MIFLKQVARFSKNTVESGTQCRRADNGVVKLKRGQFVMKVFWPGISNWKKKQQQALVVLFDFVHPSSFSCLQQLFVYTAGKELIFCRRNVKEGMQETEAPFSNRYQRRITINCWRPNVSHNSSVHLHVGRSGRFWVWNGVNSSGRFWIRE